MTPVLRLLRITNRDDVTLGVLLDDAGLPVCVTLEEPWKNNQHDVSCIPAGRYTAHRIVSPKRHYPVYELVDVPNRSHVQLHIANTVLDIEGCIAVGSGFGALYGLPAVRGSKVAFDEFMERFTTPTIELDIVTVAA